MVYNISSFNFFLPFVTVPLPQESKTAKEKYTAQMRSRIDHCRAWGTRKSPMNQCEDSSKKKSVFCSCSPVTSMILLENIVFFVVIWRCKMMLVWFRLEHMDFFIVSDKNNCLYDGKYYFVLIYNPNLQV